MTATIDSYWDVIDPHWSAFCDALGGRTELSTLLALMPKPVLQLASAHIVQSEVRNGGFFQLFANSSGKAAVEGLKGFALIGTPQIAAVVQGAMERLGDPYPTGRSARQKANSAVRNVAVEAAGGKVDSWFSAFDAEDDAFYDLIDTENGGFDDAATAYVIAAGLA
jgi:hypothetical protein